MIDTTHHVAGKAPHPSLLLESTPPPAAPRLRQSEPPVPRVPLFVDRREPDEPRSAPRWPRVFPGL
jgi:hypothetical protein